MQYEFIGRRTGKVYARGYRSDCFRQLQKDYPSTYDRHETENGRRKIINVVYPEVLLIRPVKKTVIIERG